MKLAFGSSHSSIAYFEVPPSEKNSSDSLMDPLGAMNMSQNLPAAPKQTSETMSPSRLRFIKEHSTSPFANEVFFVKLFSDVDGRI